MLQKFKEHIHLNFPFLKDKKLLIAISGGLDSVVLTLDAIGLYGDTATPMAINVYELSNDLLSSTDYYSNTYVAHNLTSLGGLTFKPNLTDSVDIDFGARN